MSTNAIISNLKELSLKEQDLGAKEVNAGTALLRAPNSKITLLNKALKLSCYSPFINTLDIKRLLAKVS